MSTISRAAGNSVKWVDDRLTTNVWLKRNLRKVFPDHWSFLLGEIAMFSLILLIISGIFLTLWFKPSTAEVIYDGSFERLRGVPMSEAYASTLDISFDVRGGLLMRQIHHWSALIFVAAMIVHATRILVTGAFRKPREINYVIGFTMLILGIIEGFLGYSLPDDLLSGTGLRITEGIILAMPVVGTYVSFFLFGGEFPGEYIIPRFYSLHILLIPGIILALFTLHLIILWYQKHTQYPGPGKTDENVVGYPFFPVYVAKAGGFQFIVWGVIALMGAFIQINPIWIWGPYSASDVSAGSQPDWYMGFLDGLLRIMPNWETHIFGYNISWNILIPAMVVPGLLLTPLILYPWIERFVTGDRREHHVLDRPRNQPVRTALIAALATFIILGMLGGGNDLIATIFSVPINLITWTLRIGIFVLPVIVFFATKRICLGLQHKDRDKVMHGFETGVIERLPHGEFVEMHAPLDDEEAYELAAHERQVPHDPGPEYDENGVPAPHRRKENVRAGISRFYYEDVVQKPTPEEYAAAQRHHDASPAELTAEAAGERPHSSTESGGESSH
jgi:ubiquinol-cytochrome c reductase cytochrome b subunit